MRPCSAATPAPGGRTVLVVDAEDPWRPGYVAFMTAFRTALQGATPTPVAIYGENLDLIRFESPAYRAALRRWYEAKYGDRRHDEVVAAGPAVLGLLQTWRAELWPNVPLVFVADARTLAWLGMVGPKGRGEARRAHAGSSGEAWRWVTASHSGAATQASSIAGRPLEGDCLRIKAERLTAGPPDGVLAKDRRRVSPRRVRIR